jgi:2,4-dienoyl-CoA reductase-like NADH-dependent reductase (Old Yellow Enzyme family)
LDLYENLAAGGLGMIISGHMAVIPEGRAGHHQTCIWEDKYIEQISKIADRIHQTSSDCKVIGQVSHCGRQVLGNNNLASCVGPSDVPSPLLEKRGRTLTVKEIDEIINAFAQAVERVQKAGFDGAQLHAAHGYLLSSFLSPYTNHRTDKYGGSVKNRCLIINEIITQARKKVGIFPILIKMNCNDYVEGGININTFPELALEIENTGVDAIEISGCMWDCLGRSEEELGFPAVPIPESRYQVNKPEQQSYFARYIENLNLKIPVILVGGNRNVEHLEAILREGYIDYFSFSRPLICEPDLPKRWLEGRGSENAECISCNSCLMSLLSGITTCLFKHDKEKYKFAKQLLSSDGWRDIFK